MQVHISKILKTVLLFFIVLVPLKVGAQIGVQPLIIDRVVAPRDTISESITLRNESERKIVVFATVNEITLGENGEVKEFVSPVMTDRKNTVTSWIEITRGRIELDPGETIKVPITFKVHPYAETGDYYAFIGFVPSTKRPVAEEVAMRGDAEGVVIKLALGSVANESVRISQFLVDRFITSASEKEVLISVTNEGDTNSIPEGEVIFYDSRGSEIGSTFVNKDQVSIAPGETKTLAASIPLGTKVGRYKANVNLNYGENLKASVFDTTQFYMIPIPILILLLLAVVVFSLVVTLLLRRTMTTEGGYSEDGHQLPLYVNSGKPIEEKDHDITISKKNE